MMTNNNSTNRIDIYIDGARPGVAGELSTGGWGVLFIIDGEEEFLYGGENKVTHNQMEILAAIKALEALPVQSDFPVTIYSDSTYVVNGASKWMKNWKKKNWHNVKNVDYWKALDKLASKHKNINWQWVRGHSGVYGNEFADKLACLGVKETREANKQ